MTALSQIAVLKFGGTSLATAEQRATAIARVKDARAGGFTAVAVVSALGRAPEPYATDTLQALGGGASATRNADLLLSCGESIAAAVFASELCKAGIDAVALTGAQAGIITNLVHGDATILRVDPRALRALLDEGIMPVVAGFQGATDDGIVTTLGRGGSDLSAIAVGHSLGAERVDIYTDVSGAMTGDPGRIDSARTIERASLDEMTELAEHGAKVMHHKAADYARRTQTPYAIKGLASNVGTVVDEAYDHHRPVTGVTASGRVTWVRAIRGDIENPEARMQLELEMFRRVSEAEISIDQVTINQSGICFVVEGDQGNELRRLLGDLNLAVRVREGCAKLSVVGAGMRYAPGVIHAIVSALSRANVEIIHCTDSNITVSVLIPQDASARAERAVHDQFHLANEDPK
jgi:aspartate kinase